MDCYTISRNTQEIQRYWFVNTSVNWDKGRGWGPLSSGYTLYDPSNPTQAGKYPYEHVV